MNKKFLFAMALPLVFTACSQEELVNEAPNQNVKAEGISGLTFNIAKEDGFGFDSRATMGSDNVLRFEKDEQFWNTTHAWQNKGWEIALHGYDHVCITNEGGINPVNPRSEFAGVSLELQKEKVRKGIA